MQEILELDADNGQDWMLRNTSARSSRFEVVFLRESGELVVYLLSAWSMAAGDEARFVLEVEGDKGTVKTIVAFTKKAPFCVVAMCEVPRRVGLTSASPVAGDMSYVGIYNLGLTCYMASALQFLASFTPFVQLVFDQSPEERTTSFELQRLFGAIKAAGGPVSIKDFLTSFDKKAILSMVAREQDAHEFMLTLFDRADNELGKGFEKDRMELFGVTSAWVIECSAVNKREVREEQVSEIQLPVAGYRGLYDSLKFVTAVEKLTGDNKWDAGDGLGMHDAVRYMKFSKLPPLLIFQLCRFAYNPVTGRCEEVRSAFDCPAEIDMRSFCTDAVQNETKYVLTAVIAHRGTLSTGHYVAFLQPRVDGSWFLFNDDLVRKVPFSDVRSTFVRPSPFHFTSYLSWGDRFLAYVVGYIRKDCIAEQVKPLEAPPSIAPSLSSFLCARFTFPEDLHEDKVYGLGKRIDWDMDGMTIEDLARAERDEVGNYCVFFKLSHIERFFGPVAMSGEAATYTLRGCLTEFFFVPKEESDVPVFFLRKGYQAQLISVKHLFERFGKDYSFDMELSVAQPGNVIRGKEKCDAEFIINDATYTVPSNWTYADLQSFVADGNEELAARILFCCNNVIMTPAKFPTIQHIRKLGNTLNYIVVAAPATVNSLSMFQEVVIHCYLPHEKTVKNFLAKDARVKTLMSLIPQWCGFDKMEYYALSIDNEREVTNILCETSLIPKEPLRLDMLPCPLPMRNSEYEACIKKYGFTVIEVRVVTYTSNWKTTKTLGFHKVASGQTTAEFYGILQEDHGDISHAFRLLLGGTSNSPLPVCLSEESVLTDVIQEQMQTHKFGSERFVFTVQMNKKKLPSYF